ncbi:phosphofructokinase family protein [Candidatus Phytoplasma oryzae]|uniref:6-phosphofructokinase n=1 Tax=Candidatus Phytoplasma oryzae TaxID=203274 RepID=A0A139JRH4_9MOLU|nr:ATP-dependent 6-phosphofructokinase [Candidatus Phytoplasma oryzae]KXT29444.1 phosphofructokinase family protein [Candidatus Phytoplasma oryzae]RAM58024.1 6-phosphofructokinase [Candidatus Phytoplasma oryzae]
MKLEKKYEKIAILTSGGDAPGMNSVIRTVFLTSQKKNYKVYSIKDGFLGLYKNKIEEMTEKSFPSRILNISGTFLGTSRFIEFKTDKNIRQKCIQNLKQKNIETLIVVGGNGSYQGTLLLSRLGLKCIGIPATIDNDINYNDFTIGFSTAVNNITDAIDKIRDTSISHHRCTIIEVMGRITGDLALYGGIAKGVDIIITPQNIIPKKKILEKTKVLYNSQKRHLIIIITENILNIVNLAQEIEKYSGFETRVQVLGHIQRGGNPTAEDLFLSSQMGYYAVNLLSKGIYNVGVSFYKGDLCFFTLEKILEPKIIKNPLINLIKF